MADPAPSRPDPSVEAWALTVPESVEDEVSGLVWNLGCHGITIDPALGGEVRLVCFFPEPADAGRDLLELTTRFGGSAQLVQVPNPDWVSRFKETFLPFDAPPFRVVPEWREEETGECASLHRLRVDPGRAFGTGTHESTRLCLRALGSLGPNLPVRPRTLDLGCGTGILGIGAAMLLGARVTACDHDPLATASAARHARLNQTSLNIALMDGCRGFRPGSFDLVLANLMAPFLISRAAEITAMAAPGGRFILAGLLRDEEEPVRAAWPSSWSVASSYEGEWASLRYERS